MASAVASNKKLKQYECGGFQFSGKGSPDYYDRHLVFDHAVSLEAASQRERFEAVASSLRDLLTQRWLRTEETYDKENPKRVYYLSMEFLIGRTLVNNIINLGVEQFVQDDLQSDPRLDWKEVVETEPDAGLGNGGLGRLAACFVDSLATLQIPAMGYGLRYEYGIFRQTIEKGYQVEHPDNWLAQPDPWEVARPAETVHVPVGCSFHLEQGTVRAAPGHPSTLLGVPYDRPVVGYGGRTVNTLRLWQADSPDFFNLGEFSTGDFVGAMVDRVLAETVTRVLYPDDSTAAGQGTAIRSGVLPGLLLARRHRRPLPPRQRRLAAAARQGCRPAQRHAPLHGRRRADAHPPGPGEARLGRSVGPDGPHARLHQPHAAARSPREVAGPLLRAGLSPAAGDHLRDQSPFPRRRAAPFPGRRRSRCAA